MNNYHIAYRRFGELTPRKGAVYLISAIDEAAARKQAVHKLLTQFGIVVPKITSITLVEDREVATPAKEVEMSDLLEKFDPAKHRHELTFGDGPTGTETVDIESEPVEDSPVNKNPIDV